MAGHLGSCEAHKAMMYATEYTLCSGPCGRLFASHPMANAWGVMENYTIIMGKRYCLDCTTKVLAEHGIVPEVKIVSMAKEEDEEEHCNAGPAPHKPTWWQRLFR